MKPTIGTLFIVSTPIGNLKDITLRALEILKSVDFILCEDTRTSKTLLNHFQIQKPLVSYHQHSTLFKQDQIIKMLSEGKNAALISDAGTPGISDPGNKLVEAAVKAFGETIRIVPVPGPSAAVAALSVSGFKTDKFVFLGFPPAKNKRTKYFSEALSYSYPVVFYESAYRIIKTLEEIDALNSDKSRRIVVCRELTKAFETIYRGVVSEVVEKIKKDPRKGEFVVVLE